VDNEAGSPYYLRPEEQSAVRIESTPAAWIKGVRFETLGNLAHELRTPIQVLIGYLDILRDEYRAELGPEPREIIERMNTNAYDLAQTIDNLMEFVLSEANAEARVDEDISLKSLLTAEISPALEAANLKKQLNLSFELGNAPEIIRAPRRALKSIILNLGLNAIKFTDAGKVTIVIRRARASEGSDLIEIEVSDSGPGMSQVLLDQALKPFSQLSNSSVRHYRGLGLGLALAQRNVALLGGKLELRSTPGHGANFIARFPTRHEAAGAHAQRGILSQQPRVFQVPVHKPATVQR
jgi:two-component system, sensor histidine kinase and response regulator